MQSPQQLLRRTSKSLRHRNRSHRKGFWRTRLKPKPLPNQLDRSLKNSPLNQFQSNRTRQHPSRNYLSQKPKRLPNPPRHLRRRKIFLHLKSKLLLGSKRHPRSLRSKRPSKPLEFQLLLQSPRKRSSPQTPQASRRKLKPRRSQQRFQRKKPSWKRSHPHPLRSKRRNLKSRHRPRQSKLPKNLPPQQSHPPPLLIGLPGIWPRRALMADNSKCLLPRPLHTNRRKKRTDPKSPSPAMSPFSFHRMWRRRPIFHLLSWPVRSPSSMALKSLRNHRKKNKKRSKRRMTRRSFSAE